MITAQNNAPSKQPLQEQGIQEKAYFEYVVIPNDRSFLWRMDDYPLRRSAWNYHPEFEVHLIKHSSGLCYVGDFIGNFDAGQLVLVGSNLPHNWITPTTGSEQKKKQNNGNDSDKIIARDIVLQFNPQKMRESASTLCELEQLEPLFQRASMGIEFTGETAKMGAEILEKMASTSGLQQLSQLIELLALMSQSEEYRNLATPRFVSQFKPSNSNDLKVLEKAMNYIQMNYLEGPKLADVASIAGMSDSSFSRFFKLQTGNTYSDHINILKIWTARSLLAGSNMAVTDICYESGFSNISNFNRIFLRQSGITPLQYRKASNLLKTT